MRRCLRNHPQSGATDEALGVVVTHGNVLANIEPEEREALVSVPKILRVLSETMN